ncbi:MAG TPA: DoxX family protein [Bacteroidales bacterium]|nr:DoxX family protein [Bacteroidales bacterium]
MKILRLLSRITVGILFMFSGTVKAIDPLGSAYKFNDYFQAFHLEFLKPFSLGLAILLFTAEFISGFSVLSGYRQKTGIWGVMILMLIFTPLTLILAITNPVTDCGCFGDAIHLTNWQTFGKNIVLMAMAVILFTGRGRVRQISNANREWFLILIVTLLFIVFSLLNIRYLQLFDFLPYKTGTNIPASMVIPEGKAPDEYLTTFIYEKDGIEKEFTLENYPADDSSWKFVDQKSRLIKKGYLPPIHDFSITAPDGQDISNNLLSYPGYTLIMISRKLKEAAPQQLGKGFELGVHCMTAGIGFYILTASGSSELSQYNNGFNLFTGDETTLKTIIRSNPGYILLKNGTIMGKWSPATLPPKVQFNNGMTDKQVERMNNKSLVLVIYSLLFSAIVFALLISSPYVRNKGGNEIGYL